MAKGQRRRCWRRCCARAGYRTGLYTSPHLVRVNERIQVAGEEIADLDFAAVSADVVAAVERLLARHELPAHPSFFESLTAIAFEHFRRARCEIAAVEVGMGGRLDATSALTPLLSIIMPVEFDHEPYLGHTLEQIAFEKAGIIKEGGVVVSAAQHPEAAAVLERVARERGARLVYAQQNNLLRLNGQLRLALPGRHQAANAAVVTTAIEELRRLGVEISLGGAGRGSGHSALAGAVGMDTGQAGAVTGRRPQPGRCPRPRCLPSRVAVRL